MHAAGAQDDRPGDRDLWPGALSAQNAGAIPLGFKQPTPEANSLWPRSATRDISRSGCARHRREVEEDLLAGRVKGVIVLAADFSDRLGRGDAAPVQILVDGSDPNTAGLVLNYAQGVWGNWLVQEAFRPGRPGPARPAAIDDLLEPRYWFNPEARSQNFLIPGSVAIIMTLIGTLLTALVVAREWERGTIEALMTTPVGVVEFLLGKLHSLLPVGHGRDGAGGDHGRRRLRRAVSRLDRHAACW